MGRQWTAFGGALALALGCSGESGRFAIPLEPSAVLEIDGTVQDIELLDLDGDGAPDVIAVATNSAGPDVVVRLRNGGFAEVLWSSPNRRDSAGVAFGDLDGDGIENLAFTHNRDPSEVFRGRGDGTLESEPLWQSTDERLSSDAHLRDFDGDGHTDILTIAYGDDHGLYRGSTDGPETERSWKTTFDSCVSKSALADVDGDGRDDLVVCCIGPAYEVYRATERGFERQPSQTAKFLGENSSLAVGDVDGDGFPEITVGSRAGGSGDGRVRLYANRSGHLTREPVWLSDDVDAEPDDLVLDDLDCDGDIDLLVVNGERSAIYENQAGKLAATPAWRGSLPGEIARVADLDRNGYPDIIVAGREAVRVFRGGPHVPITTAKPLSVAPDLGPVPHVDALEIIGVRVAAWTPALAERYKPAVPGGVVVLSAPADVAWRLSIGNLREGDVVTGVGSDCGASTFEPVHDPVELRSLILKHGRRNERYFDLIWKCGPLHPGREGELRQENLYLSAEAWAEITPDLDDPLAVPIVERARSTGRPPRGMLTHGGV